MSLAAGGAAGGEVVVVVMVGGWWWLSKPTPGSYLQARGGVGVVS